MQKVLLTIKGADPSIGGSGVEFVTEGRLYRNADGYRIEYDESDLTGSDGVTTSLLLEDGCVTLSRSGEVESHLIFSKNSVFESLLSTPDGMLHMSVLALEVESRLHDKGGSLNLEYELSVERAYTIGRLSLSFKNMDDCIN